MLFTAKILGLSRDERKTAGERVRVDGGESGIALCSIALLPLDLGGSQLRAQLDQNKAVRIGKLEGTVQSGKSRGDFA
jgi:hypothetical protein